LDLRARAPRRFLYRRMEKHSLSPGLGERCRPLLHSWARHSSIRPSIRSLLTFLSTTPFALTPDGSKLLVGTCANNLLGACQAGYVEIFNVTSAQEIAAVSLGSDEVAGIAVSPDGQTAYTTHYFDFVCVGCSSAPQAGSTIPANSITAISLATYTPGKSLTLFGSPGKLVLKPAGTRAYVAPAFGAGQLSELNLPQLTLAREVMITGGERIAISGDGSIVSATTSGYTNGGANDTLTCYRAPGLSTTGSVSLPSLSESGLVMDLAGKFAYIANQYTSLSYQVDISRMSVSTSYRSEAPLDLAMSAIGQLYCLSIAGANISVFGETSTLPARIVRAPGNTEFAVSADDFNMFVADNTGVTLISVLSGSPVASYFQGYAIYSIALTPTERPSSQEDSREILRIFLRLIQSQARSGNSSPLPELRRLLACRAMGRSC